MGRDRTESQQLQNVVELQVPAIKIKNIDAVVENLETEVIENKVIVQGEIHKQIFFVGEDSIIHHQQEMMTFSTFVEVEGAQPGMEAQINVAIEHIKARLSPDGTQIQQKVILELFVKVVELQQLLLAQDPGGPLILVDQVIGEATTQTMVENEVALTPAAVKVTHVDVQIIEITKHIIEDKVIIQGILAKQVFFIGEDDLGHHQAEEVSFSAFVDVPGAQPGMKVQIYPRVEFVDGTLSPDGTVFFQEVVLELFVKVTEAMQINLAQGAGPLVKLPQVIGEDTVQTMVTSDFVLDQPALKIVDVQAHFQEVNTRILENKVIIQGILEKQIFFVGQDDIEYHQAEEVNFSAFVDIPGAQPGMEVELTPRVEHINFELITPTQLHQKVVMEFFLKVVEILQVNLVLDTAGPLFKVPVVIGEKVKQILVEEVVPIPPVPPIPPEVIVAAELIKEIVEVEVEEQVLVEEQIQLPVPAIKIKEINATVTNITWEVVNQQIFVEGDIIKQIHFVNAENQVRHVEEIIPFSAKLEVPELQEDMILTVDVQIEDISFQLIQQGTILSQVIVLVVRALGESSRQLEVITELEGPDIIPTVIQVVANRVIGEDIFQVDVEESLDLPQPAAFPVFVEAFLTDIVGEIEPDLVTVSGTIVKALTLATAEEVEFTVEEEIPFQFETVITGAQPGDDLQLQIEIIDILVELIEEGNVAVQTVILEALVKVTRQEIIGVVVDVVGPVEVETETVFLDVVDDGIPHPVPVDVVVEVQPA